MEVKSCSPLEPENKMDSVVLVRVHRKRKQKTNPILKHSWVPQKAQNPFPSTNHREKNRLMLKGHILSNLLYYRFLLPQLLTTTFFKLSKHILTLYYTLRDIDSLEICCTVMNHSTKQNKTLI